jgi:uncharacterized membrane protein (UPF0127 family)
MKKILSIIVVILLFITSGLIFWAGLAPDSFSNFFSRYPEVHDVTNQLMTFGKQSGDLSDATSSGVFTSSSGQITIRNNTWKVEIANNDADRVSGLSNRKTLYNKKGMLFAFESMATQTFWMKDMLIPIDMIFFDDKWEIVLIESNLQPNTFPKTFGSNVKSQYILEVNAGESIIYGLKVGDKAIFSNK